MKDSNKELSKRSLCDSSCFECLLLAIVYFTTAKLGQLLAIPPGNITAIWIPSGIVLAALYYRGWHLWPGVFLGAFAGNAWAYLDFSTFNQALMGLLAASMNGMGDTFCVLIILWALKSFAQEGAPLISPKGVFAFILAAVVGTGADAVFGVSGLWLGNLIASEATPTALVTWWVGDIMGIMILFPLIEAIVRHFRGQERISINWESILYFLVFFTALLLYSQQKSQFLHTPAYVIAFVILLLWGIFRLQWQYVPICLFLISATILIKTISNIPYSSSIGINNELVDAQTSLFLVTSIILYVAAEVYQRKLLSDQNLALAENLEIKVEERTSNLTREIRHRKEIEEELIFQEKAYKEAQSIARIGHWRLVADTGVLTWSDEVYEIFELDKKTFKASYEAFLNLVHPEERSKVDEAYRRALKTKEAYVIDHRLSLPDGRIKYVREQGRTKYTETEEPEYTLGTVQDVTEEVISKFELVRQKEKADEANKAKSQFLNLMSHELRTPMNGVLGMAQLLKFSELSSEQSEQIDVILDSGNALVNILSDILDLSKIEAGKQGVHPKVFCLKELLDNIVSLFHGSAQLKGLLLEYTIQPDVHTKLSGDTELIKRILTNLVGNAVKFTEKGGIKISVGQKSDSKQLVNLEISIEDTGCGVSEEMKDKIFNVFEQVDSTNYSKYRGSGLGLAIVTKTLELLNGKISMESTLGKGSRFTVVLPVKKDTQSRVTSGEGKRSISRDQAFSDTRILVVEDEKMNQLVTTKMLSRLGVECELAKNGEEAVALTLKNRYDLILMDIRMPVLNGIEATKAIRESNKNPNKETVIIGITAYAYLSEMEKFLDSGMTHVITKPIHYLEMQKTFSTYLQNK